MNTKIHYSDQLLNFLCSYWLLTVFVVSDSSVSSVLFLFTFVLTILFPDFILLLVEISFLLWFVFQVYLFSFSFYINSILKLLSLSYLACFLPSLLSCLSHGCFSRQATTWTFCTTIDIFGFLIYCHWRRFRTISISGNWMNKFTFWLCLNNHFFKFFF